MSNHAVAEPDASVVHADAGSVEAAPGTPAAHGGGGDGGAAGHGGGGGDDHAGGSDGHGHPHRKHEAHAEHAPSAPLWLLSFADMMTNLLCFFILMSAFALQRKGLGLEDGLGSIQQDLVQAGKPGRLDGRTLPVQFNAGRVIYRQPKSINSKTLVQVDGRITDGNRDALRKVVAESLTQPGRNTLPTPLIFGEADTTLTNGHREFLDVLARMVAGGKWRIRIDGYSFEEGSQPEDGWLIAEARAGAARDWLVARGVSAARLDVVGHGLRILDPAAEKKASPADPQVRLGRRAVTLTMFEAGL